MKKFSMILDWTDERTIERIKELHQKIYNYEPTTASIIRASLFMQYEYMCDLEKKRGH